MKNHVVIGRCLLLELLNEKYMAQSDLSVLTGISRVQINEYIGNNRLMSLKNAIIICCALGCNFSDIYMKLRLSKSRH